MRRCEMIRRESLQYSAKELTTETLGDLERLLETHPAPGAYECWCMYNHRTRPLLQKEKAQHRETRAARNRIKKRELVRRDLSHGVLVYAEGGPVGWCQFGLAEELPRIDGNPGYRRLVRKGRAGGKWRITCFVVLRKYRRRGVASFALKAALEAIKSKGGGTVQAYPIVRWGAYQDFRGTVSMFRKLGFGVVSHYGTSNVVMRKTV